MFKKILIANRGEIALRVMRTCNELGIKTVAVFSEADRDALHVKYATEAYYLGGPRVKESYLNADKIIEIAKDTKAEAIHPGYGLLSENAEFAKKCEHEGIIFIGPSSHVIEKMGSKIESRKTMDEIGVPIIPGINYSLNNINEAKDIAQKMGYPIMLKASAGGGGIGMQIINNAEELDTAFSSNQKRATDFFDDGSIFLEKYIEDPRHIEVQLLADKKGNTIYLGERECSIQRRHQKVIEESPSPFLDQATRERMGETAVRAARHIGYTNAGTIEFLVDAHRNFYFLEMNTRLQVEHPVTEEVTGIDIVEQQLRIAAGEELTIKQSDIKMKGHAIEVRIYAEDPKTFFPSPGKISKLILPEGDGIRNEVGMEEGTVITPFYDPMIAKLIVKAESRNQAIDRISDALNQYQIVGIKTNIPLLQKIMNMNEYKEGKTTTNFISKYIN